MNRLHHSHDVLHRLSHRKKASPYANPLPIAPEHIDKAFQEDVLQSPTPALVARSPDSSTTSSSSSAGISCGPNDNSGACEKNESDSNTMTLPIVLGAVVPIVIALCVMVYLHRRHVKKLRKEDADDPHKSLDFGLDMGSPLPGSKKKKKKGGIPEMVITDPEKSARSRRQISMDMGLESPYLLPPEVHNSRESFHSLSRSMRGDDDPYRHVSAYIPTDGASVYSRKMGEDSSIRTGSSGGDPMKQDLLKNAQRMSMTTPPVIPDSLSAPMINGPAGNDAMPRKPLPIAKVGTNAGLTVPGGPEDRDSYIDKDRGNMRKSNDYLGSYIRSNTSAPSSARNSEIPRTAELPAQDKPTLAQTEKRKAPPPAIQTPSALRPSRLRSMEASVVIESAHNTEPQSGFDNESDYGDALKVTPPSPREETVAAPEVAQGSLEVDGLGYDIRRLSMGVRPLPPDDPSDDPEQRANRIRSFYREYFDETKPDPQNGYYEEDLLGEGAIYDPETGGFIYAGGPPQAPFAQGLPRRAMTPPPRAPPRFRAPPRNFSSLSGCGPVGPRGRPTQPKKRLPPPSPLQVLPTPHLLRDDSTIFMTPIDFAPPARYKDRQANRPDSPLGGAKPYSPSTPVHIPLASSFDDLSVMPSPHALRKSGTFTGLDFAPRHRFHNGDGGGSDAGSIRSARSGISAQQLHAVRAGAYRVSRLPKDFVGTKQDLLSSLRPTWDLRDPTPTYPTMA